MVQTDLRQWGSCTLESDGCSTCGDIAVPVEVLQIEGQQALVQDRLGQRAWVATDFTPEVVPGDALLVHLGIALWRLP